MRLPLATLEIFVAIARQGSLRGAADALGLKPSTVSHQLKTLEGQLDTALFVRTTRSLSLTEAGRALLRGAGPAFDQLDSAVETARTTGHTARGSLRLALPDFVYPLLVGPSLLGFARAYPEISVELSLTDAFSDILSEGLHAGFRLGDRITQDMVAVRLTPPLKVGILASPAYIARHGRPQRPEDLLGHHCLHYRFQSVGKIAPWRLTGPEGPYDVEVAGSLTVNTLPALVDLAKQGLGLAYTFLDFCRPDLESGALVPVLAGHVPDVPGVYLYFPREYRTMVPLRLFLEALKAQAAQTPWM
ncbi:MAG: LysR substrate-binding domain-containing protein [Rhodospirillaceae bacterium]